MAETRIVWTLDQHGFFSANRGQEGEPPLPKNGAARCKIRSELESSHPRPFRTNHDLRAVIGELFTGERAEELFAYYSDPEKTPRYTHLFRRGDDPEPGGASFADGVGW